MFRHIFGSRRPVARPHLVSPPRRQRVLAHRSLVCSFLLTLLLLLSQMLGNWGFLAQPAQAASAGVRPSAPASMTFQQALKQANPGSGQGGPFVFPRTSPHMPFSSKEQLTDYSHLPPSAEPVTMQPISQPLTSAFLAGSAGTGPLDLKGSDGRMEVQVAPGSLDLSQAKTSTGAAASGSLILNISEIHGHFVGAVNLLGSYQLQVTDVQGHPFQGVRLRKPVTFIYHYKPDELTNLDLNPDNLLLTWPDLAYAARQAHQPTTDFIIALHNDPGAHTLTGQSRVLGITPFDMGGGDPENQSPVKPHLASVQGNSGQLSYSYPLVVAPGPPGTTPSLALAYSSSTTNERHSRTSPTDNMGEGWTLSVGSITADVYPYNSAGVGTWYFISGVDNISDRLVPDSSGTSFLTEHISQLRVRQVTSSFGQPCFNVWDTSGNYYQFGCTTDSLQYRTDSAGRHNYRWDLNSMIPANEGPGTATRSITISYLQDSVTTNGYTSVRDAVMKQITYGGSTRAGTVDFLYRAPFNSAPWATAYGTNYNCSNPPIATTLRCDDPLNYSGGLNASTVISTFTLQTVKTYVGDDSSSSHLDYSYSLGYQETPFSKCWDDYTQSPEYCAGSHLLTSVTPTVYQNGTPHQLKGLTLGYTSPLQDGYYDSTHTIQNGTQQYHIQTYWQYLNSYYDSSNGVGGSMIYQLAYNNTHGTPYDSSTGDDRHDPVYCSSHSNCTGTFAWPEDRAWSEQVVLSITTSGKDSSASNLSQATTTYHYRLAVTGTGCPADSTGDTQCVGDNWTPKGNTGNIDQDWIDYFHSEFRGFNVVYISSPAGDVTADTYASTLGWATYEGSSGNYTAGDLYEEDIYSGSATSGALLSKTVNTYAGNNGTASSCNGNYSGVYTPCEVMVTSSRTTQFEGTGSNNTNAPWVQHDYTYDDYNSAGLAAGYHNTLQEVISSANAPTVTRKWTYKTTDTTVGSWVYYDVHRVTHSEVDDATGHVWQCQDITYDEGAASGVPSPAAGWPTTQKAYTNCADPNTAITTYTGYDINGNEVAAVDGVATSNSGLYSSKGCTLSTAPFIFTASSNWGGAHYTACTTYDSYQAQTSTATNALGQQSSTSYDYTQGALLTSATDVNSQTVDTSYSYDSNGNRTARSKPPLESGSYTKQSTQNSNCSTTSTLPCFEMDSNGSQYPNAVKRTFYDSLGRQVETRSPGPGPGYDTIIFTVYNDANHSTFESVPFEVASGNTWVDPNGAVDYQNVAPGVTVTYFDALNRPIALQDPLYGSGQEPGIPCPSHQGTQTACTVYGLGSPQGDATVYAYIATIDPNNHATVSFMDALGRTRYVQHYSGVGLSSLSSNINEQSQTQYNALDKPTSVTSVDLAPQSGQSITQVTTSATYDDLGRLTKLSDPDQGTHTYTYDADGRLLSDVVGNHTLGYNDDLLGRVGCIQDAVPTLNATGACSAGNPYVQNTYDTTVLGTQGSTDFPVGRLTQSVATTYYPDSSSATVTESYQHDARGRLVTEQMQLGVPSGWNVTTALPTYQLAQSFNDANQPVTTTTSTSPSGQGFTTTLVYDSTTGVQTGLSNNGTATSNLAALVFNARAQLDTIDFLTGSGSALMGDQFGYDANLRPTTTTATWQGGSGNSGTAFSQARTYDPASNVISLSTTSPTVPGYSGTGGSETSNFCYDEQSQLVWAGNSGTQPAAGSGTCGSGTLASGLNGASYSNSYVYTHLGQLWQGPLPGSNTPYQYLYCNSQPHELSGLYALGSTCSSKSGQGYASTYDPFGNVTSRSFSGTTATLSYDNLNHFTQWYASSNNQEQYVYDASGERMLRRFTNSSGTTILTYPFGLEEHRYSGSGSNQWNTYYYSLAGHLIGSLDGNGTTFYITDALGSILTSFNNAPGGASIKGAQGFGPYGNGRYYQGNINTAKGFTGQYNDGTGLDYYNARYYDPVVGVFLSADTVEGNMQGKNPYAYVDGNPETKNDPTGHADPYLMYIVAWYRLLHPGETVLAPPRGLRLPNSAVPRGVPRATWPALVPVGTTGPGYPDIANEGSNENENENQHILWEAKTGGGFGPGMGLTWPSNDTVRYGSAQVAWYAARARLVNDPSWQVGNTTAGTPGYDAAIDNYFRTSPNCTGAGGICTISFEDGTVIQIRIPTNAGRTAVSGVISYRVIHQRFTPDPIPTVITNPFPWIPVSIWYLPGSDEKPKKQESIDPFLEVQTFTLSLVLNLSGFGFGFGEELNPSPAPVIGTGPVYRCRCF